MSTPRRFSRACRPTADGRGPARRDRCRDPHGAPVQLAPTLGLVFCFLILCFLSFKGPRFGLGDSPSVLLAQEAGIQAAGIQAATGDSEAHVQASAQHLFDRLAANAGRVSRIGRRISLFVENHNVAGDWTAAENRVIRVTEDVFVDGAATRTGAGSGVDPRFAVRFVSVEGDGLTQHGRAMRKAQLEAIEGFSHHFGGFRVRDARQAKQNYRVIEHRRPIVRLGRAMRLYDVLPNDANKSSYRLLVDIEHDTVVDELEIAPSGMLVRSRFYVTLQLGEKLEFPQDVDWWQPWNHVSEHSSLDAAERATGVRARTPNAGAEGYLPFSYRSATHSISKQRYLIIGYTDGIDYRFLLQSRMTPERFEKHTGLVVNDKNLRVFHCQLGPAPQYFAYQEGLALILVGSFHPTEHDHATRAGQPVIPEMFLNLLR